MLHLRSSPLFPDKEKKKKKHKSGDKSEKSEKNGHSSHKHSRTSPTPSAAETGVDLDKDVPSPPPAPIFKETSEKSGSSATNGSSSSKSEKTVTTAKQHNYKERSAGVEEGVIKPKPRGSKPAKSASGKPTTSVASAMASHKRCDAVYNSCGLQNNDLLSTFYENGFAVFLFCGDFDHEHC